LDASGNHYNVGAPDCGNRLSQAPCRQNQSATEWIGGIDENNISVASQSQMLKAIVEDKPFGSMPREDAAIFVSIAAHADLYFSRKAFA